MRKMTVGFFLSLICLSLTAKAAESTKMEEAPAYEIHKYRFNPKKKGGAERFVIQFKEKGSPIGLPEVKVVKDSATEAMIEVKNAPLVGAIPEAAMSDSVVKKSRFVNQITMNTDSPAGGFSLRSGLKTEAVVKASWATKPSRLVIDISGDTKTADRGEPHFGHLRPRPSMTVAHGDGNEEYLCFPSNAQVGLSVTFQPKKPKDEIPNVRIDLDAAQAAAADSSSDAIVCYPSSAQVFATISFHDSRDTNGFIGSASTASKSPFVWNPAAPPPGEKPVSRPRRGEPADGREQRMAVPPPQLQRWLRKRRAIIARRPAPRMPKRTAARRSRCPAQTS